MRVLLAPDSFKGSIGAADAAAALARGWRAARPGDEVACLPLADGGEGTLDILAAAVPGARWHPVTVTGPGGAPAASAWLELPGEPRRWSWPGPAACRCCPGPTRSARPRPGPAS